MSKDTHAFLPAHKIVSACAAAKEDIRQARAEIALDVARAMRRMRPWLWLRPIDAIVESMPAEIKEITRQHRFREEGAIDDIHALARAVMEQGDDFQVAITANDFYLLKDFYP